MYLGGGEDFCESLLAGEPGHDLAVLFWAGAELRSARGHPARLKLPLHAAERGVRVENTGLKEYYGVATGTASRVTISTIPAKGCDGRCG